MKIRAGFVSNSSSASFSVIWQVLDDKEYTAEEAVKQLFDFDGRDALIARVAKDTTQLQAKNTFESTFFTSMLNAFGDFGEAAEALMFNLYCHNLCSRGDPPKTVILKTNIESGGGW